VNNGSETVPERTATYREVFAVRAYRHLFTASLLSQSGDQLTKVAMASLVLERTGSAILTAATYAITYLPWVLGGPLLSAYADRLPRRRVLVAADECRVGLVLLLAVPGTPTPVLILILFGSNLLGSPFNAAQAALMPELLAGDRYVVANGLDAIVRQVAQVGGFALGGVAVWAFSPTGALLADSATFAASALLILRGLPVTPAPPSESHERTSLLRDSAEGARVVFGDRRLRAYVLMFWGASSFTFAYEAIAIPYAADLGGTARTAGLILAAGPLGQATGILVLSRLVTPANRLRLILPMAILSTAALIPLLVVTAVPAILGLLVLAGFGAAFSAPLNSLFGRAVPAAYRGRAFGLVGAGISLCYGLTEITAGALADLPHLAKGAIIGCSGIAGTVLVLSLIQIWPTQSDHSA
jgi:MFS family permease